MSYLQPFTFVWPILPGKTEAWRRFIQELLGSRRREYETSRRRLGIKKEQIWLVPNPQGEMAVFTIEADDPAWVIAELATSEFPFDRWFAHRLLTLLGMDVTKMVSGPPSELLLGWQETNSTQMD